MILKVTTEFTHNEIVKPVLKLLSDKRFNGAQEEFLLAHKNYREQNKKECISNCLKSFESTMKIICKIKKIKIDDDAPAKKIIAKLFESGYIPSYLQSFGDNFNNMLKSIFESCVPTIRNNVGGHGQGDKIIEVDDNLASFVLNMTASNIVFLVSLLKDNK
jgi:virulence-associated protein VapD